MLTPLILLALQSTALVGATVVDGTGGPAISNAVVVVTGDRITCVGTAMQCPLPPRARRVDVAGRFITPGLVDAHVHFSQTGWIDGRPDGLAAPDLYPYAETARRARANPDRWYRSYLCSGITAVYDVGGHPWTTRLPMDVHANPMAPHVRAVGPLVTHARRPQLNLNEEFYTFLPMNSAQDVQESVAKLVAMGASAVKVWYLEPSHADREELDQRMIEVGAAARAAGLDLIVHATELREAKVALRAGAVMLVHSVDDEPVDQEFLDLMRQQNAIYAPTVTVHRGWTVAIGSIALGTPHQIDDPNQCVDSATRANIANVEPLRALLPERLRAPELWQARFDAVDARTAVMAENLRRVHAAGITVATATDAGNPLTMHGPSIYGEMEAMEAAGIPPGDVIIMSTRNGARAMGRLRDFGTVQVGKIADLLVLADDPRESVRAFRSLTHVMRAGRLHPQPALRVR